MSDCVFPGHSTHPCKLGQEYKRLEDCLSNCKQHHLTTVQKKIIKLKMFELMRKGQDLEQEKIRLRSLSVGCEPDFLININVELDKYSDTRARQQTT